MALCVLPALAGAQRGSVDTTAVATPAPESGPRLVRGRVVRPTPSAIVPVHDVWVILHRVGSDTAAPIDSMRTGKDGSYSFRYRATGRSDAVYFLSASYDGIAYFSLPLREPRVTGADAEITVYDTSTGPVPLHVRGRHVIISAPRVDGAREVVEVYELSNDSTVTLISPDDSRPTWSAVLPGQAVDFEVGQGDVSPRSIHVEQGRVATVAPFAPGIKQLSFAYWLPAKSFPLSIPVEHDTQVLEILAEEPSARVSGGGLAAVAPATVERRTFQRFLAHDVQHNAVVTIATPAAGELHFDKRYVTGVAIAIAVTMAGAFALVLARRRRVMTVAPVGPRTRVTGPDAGEAERLARAIAALDAEFERLASPSDEECVAYRARRGELKRKLALVLDARRERA